MRAAARIFVSLVAFALLWLVAAPAYAQGPLCDTRGASAVAPTPVVQPMLLSIDIGDECGLDEAALRFAEQGRGQRVQVDSGDPAAIGPQLPVVFEPSCFDLPAIVPPGEPRPAHSQGSDRPPRR